MNRKSLAVTRIPAMLIAVLGILFASNVHAQFQRSTIDATFFGDCIGIGDVDGDNQKDIVVGGKSLVWYKNPSWTKTEIAAANLEFMAGAELADMDKDGDLDVVTSDGGGIDNVVWFKNPRLGGGQWTRHAIGSQAQFKWDWVNDLVAIDLSRNGRIDVLTRGASKTHIFQDTATSGMPKWFDRELSYITGRGEQHGLGVVDLDKDGFKDILLNWRFLQSPYDSLEGEFTGQDINSNPYAGRTSVAYGDFDGDDSVETVFSVADSIGDIKVVFPPASGAMAPWTREYTAATKTGYVRSVKVADIDGDGKKDIVFAEMGELSDSGRIAFCKNGGNGQTWTVMKIDTVGAFAMQVADVDGNGGMDIVACDYDKGPVYLWKNSNGSPVIRTRLSMNGALGVLAVKSSVIITAPSAQSYQGEVVTTQGKVVRSFKGMGDQTLDFANKGLGSGTYVVRVKSGSVSHKANIVIMK